MFKYVLYLVMRRAIRDLAVLHFPPIFGWPAPVPLLLPLLDMLRILVVRG